jgi:hypothetical protein
MPKHLLVLAAATVLCAVPASAQRGASAADAKHASDCKTARAAERSPPPVPKPQAGQAAAAAESSGGGLLAHGWLSFFARPSSPLLP